MVVNKVIRKSKSDLKEYRLITLANGLRALLIADLKSPTNAPNVPAISALKREQLISGSSEGGSSDLDESDTTESVSDDEESSIISSAEDNEMEDEQRSRKKCSDVRKKQAAAALCINVGSFSDPANVPGLAHFLEHMVFMGSEKYPDENKFDAFIRLRGGNDNACTDTERTVFQFEIQPSYFHKALDIWAQFFVSPLLKKDSVDREVKAVDSEFDMALNSDECRKEQLVASLFGEDHPMGKFMWGNKKSLSTNPTSEGINVYGALKEFHKKYYSSHFMTLVLQSPEDLDTLEKWCREIFEAIPCNNAPLPSFPRTMFEYPHKVFKITPVRNIQELHLTWILPPQQQHYKTKPLHYMSWLVGHEGKGSILSLLKKKNLALSLCGGNQESGFEHNTTCSLFTINVTLTDKGYAHYCEVLDIIFQYLSMVEGAGPSERIFKEIQRIEDIDFMFQEEETPIENAVKQSQNVLLYPEEDILTGDNLLFEFDEECIKNVMRGMKPDDCVVFLSSPDHKRLSDNAGAKKEPWFGTEYVVEDLPEEWRARWVESSFKVDPSLHLPSPNEFISEMFDLEECSDTTIKYPQLISTPDMQYKVWFRQDSHFCLPKAYIHINLVNSVSLQTPQDSICLELLAHLLIFNLAEVAYDADAASLTYGITASDNGGLILKFAGYNDKLPLLVETVTKHLKDFSTTEEDFAQRLLQHMRTYYNTLIKPSRLAKNLRLSILVKHMWSSIDKYSACKGLKYERFLSFAKQFLSSLYIESLVQGNYTEKQANGIIEKFVDTLDCRTLTEKQIVSQRVITLDSSPNVCKVKGLNPTDDCSKITVYYQVGPNDTNKSAMMTLLETVMDEPCFNTLRTIKQLGYSVYVEHHNTAGILGLSVNVLTQNSKFSVEATTKEIQEFVNVEIQQLLSDMKQEDFEAQVASVIAVMKNEDSHLGEEVDRNWHEVTSRDYNFDHIERRIRFLESCTLGDLQHFFSSTCLGSPKILVIQVRGNTVVPNGECPTEMDENRKESSSKNKESVDGELSLPPPLALEFLNSEDAAPDNPPVYIHDIDHMKISSRFYPISHVVAK